MVCFFFTEGRNKNMNKFKQLLPVASFFIIVCLVTFTLLSLLIPPADKIRVETKTQTKEKRMDILRISAIGDSLTEGVGDTTKAGGYVPILQRDLTDSEPINVIQMANFGKSGDRSDQILKRLKKNKEIQKSLAEANIITLTVGGNDLMKAIQSHIFGKLSLKSFIKPRNRYEGELQKLYDEIRKYNATAPIYQLGIYNPFFMNFEDIKEMQEITDYWNEGSKEFVSRQDNAFFVPINEEISRGLDGKSALNNVADPTDSIEENNSSAQEDAKKAVVNNLISEEDSFHPNNLGYQVIANAFKKEIIATKELWFKK